MPFQRRPQIPVKRAKIITFDAKPKGVHDANQLFRVCIAGTRVHFKKLLGCQKLACLHKIACIFHICRCRGSKKDRTQAYRQYGLFHVLLLLGAPAFAQIQQEDYMPFDPAQAKLGQLLFYDKILSGNQNISCGTCHHHDFAGTDGLSLGIGEGGVGLGPKRTAGTGLDAIKKRIPRNAPALWNLGHKDIQVLFHDGRLSVSDQFGNGFDSPAEEWLPQGLDNILAAQSLFPLTAQFEMAGNPGENEVTGAVHERIDYGWPILAKRVRTIPEYGRMFVEAFPHINAPEEVTIVEIGNALGAFMNSEWRSFDSPYDAWLAGTPLPEAAERGRRIFFEKAPCATCHIPPLFTDHDFHALGLPAFGPGRTRRFDPVPRDVGRMGETDLLEDAYKFRTPSLRNVALTAPYGHNGAYPTLAGIIRHHLDPAAARAQWKIADANLPYAPWIAAVDAAINEDVRESARQAKAAQAINVDLSTGEIGDLVAFLNALTGSSARDRPLGRPVRVPSGLNVD